MKIKKIALFLILMLIPTVFVLADGPGAGPGAPPSDGGGVPVGGAPVDGGMSLLLILGAAYGTKKFLNK
ncbi:MAG: hypothetical protein WCH34_06595 [Bacteroidota bacterium]